MSRAFVREDQDPGPDPRDRFDLPPRDDPGFPLAAAWALLEGAGRGNSAAAEAATGYRWGEPTLHAAVEQILAYARSRNDDRLEQLADRFLRSTP